jgi:hypothetical protein
MSNSMGLILEARYPLVSFLRACTLVYSCFAFLVGEQKRMAVRMSGQTGQASFRTLFDDDITIIESST